MERAINRIPAEVRDHLENILISVQEEPTEEMLIELGLPPGYPLLGIYQGSSLMDRSMFNPPVFPDTILIFQKPLEEACNTVDELRRQIEITVVHEIAHYIGISDRRLNELGYA